MKVAYVINHLNGGGAARLITLLASGMANRGHEVYLITDSSNKITYEINPLVSVIPLSPNNSHSLLSRMLRATHIVKDIRRIIDEKKPDVVISMIPSICFYTKIALLGKKIPIIFSDVTSFARKEDLFTHFIRHYFYNTADAVVIETENDKKILGNKLPKKVIIPNPISYPIFEGESDRDNRILLIGHTSRWNIKGFDMFFSFWDKLANEFPNWNLVLIGGEDEESKRYLDSFVKTQQGRSSIKYLGFQTDVDKILQKTAIYALPSRIEGFPMAFMEAMSQGCAAVCYKIHGVITEISRNGECCQLVEDGDVDSFMEKTKELMANVKLRNELSIKGREMVKEYTIENITLQWEYLCNRLLKG